MEKAIHPEVRRMLIEAGWHPDRDEQGTLELPADFEIFPAALQVLKEFGMLRVGTGGTGIDRARSTLYLNPRLADGESDRFEPFESQIGDRLYPLGEVDGGYGFLAIDRRGRVFWIMDFVQFVAEKFDESLEVLLLGKRGVASDPAFWLEKGIRMI